MMTREYLQQCTVRLNHGESQGTGFFVASGFILTCAHVVKIVDDKPINVFCKANNQTYTAKTEILLKYPLDLALLKLEGDIPKHSCVNLDEKEPKINQDLYIFGYPKGEGVNYSEGDSATFKYEGESFKKNVLLYKLKKGQLIDGFSGSPLLNLETGKVCGIVNISRDTSSDLGGRAVSTKVILEQFPDIAELNQQFHQQQKPRDSNPFQFGSPVPPESFYGRRKAILDFKNRIGAIEPQCINIVGLRRNGKTSLLHYIKERPAQFFQPEQKPLIISLDLSNGKFHSPEGILEGVRRGIKKQIGKEPWSREDNTDPFEIEDSLQELVDQGDRLIIMLDEFEAISRRLEQFQDWGEDWRSKACAGLLTMVIFSKRPVSELYQTLSLTSPFANIFSTTILGALEKKAWHKLVEDGFNKDFAPLSWIDELAGGLPYYVQMAASLWWQYRDDEQAKKEFIFQATPRFQELWKDLTEVERHALRYAAGVSGLAVPNIAIIDMLKRHGLLRQEGGLFSSVFADFIKK
ncbi:serine protease [Crocosphaera sp.]|uniref:S1 family peptidase n=1 Tax=Crocosphaera sp. TaxID=2729996 RepID=UPI002606237D|nr:serine protease [Crocosphaera sp.]MDJ0582845.1 serine protease [Crocosphaera sp.]